MCQRAGSDTTSFRDRFLGDGSVQWGQLYRAVNNSPDFVIRTDACRHKSGRAIGFSIQGRVSACLVEAKLDSNELEALAIFRGLEALQSQLGARSSTVSVLVYSDSTTIIRCIKRSGVPKSATTRKIIYQIDELCSKFSKVGFKSAHRKEVQVVDSACRDVLGLRKRSRGYYAPARQTDIEKSARFNIQELSLDRRAGKQWEVALGLSGKKIKEGEEEAGDG